MRLIPAPLHRILDFLTVVAFAVAPAVLGLTRFAATLSYTLASVHLAMTLLTRFSPSDQNLVPLRLHGAVESIVGVVLIALPWLTKWDGSPQIFYRAAGLVILLVWAISRYRSEVSPSVA